VDDRGAPRRLCNDAQVPVHIRTRRPSDLDGFVAALAGGHAADHYPLASPADPARWLTVPARMLSAWVADDDGTIAGHGARRTAA
jgi:hypothetical protein